MLQYIGFKASTQMMLSLYTAGSPQMSASSMLHAARSEPAQQPAELQAYTLQQ